MSRDADEVVTVESVDSTAASTTEATPVTVANEAGPSAESVENQAAEGTTPASTEQATEPTGPTPEEIKAAVEGFSTLVFGQEGATQGLIDGRDEKSGELTEEVLTKVKEAYVALPGASAKAKARTAIEDAMQSAIVEDLDVVKARSLSLLREHLLKASAGGRASTPKVAVDPTTAFADRAAAMMIAPNLLLPGKDVGDDWVQKARERMEGLREQIAAYRQYMLAQVAWEADESENKGEAPAEPEVDEIIRDAARIARGRRPAASRKSGTSTPKSGESGPAYSGPRRNIANHIKEFFSSKESGDFARCGEIAKFKSSEYPNGDVSQGAVSAHLFPANGKAREFQGYAAATDESGVKGARKA